MKRTVLALAALATLSVGATLPAKALDVGVGPSGVYVGPHRHYYDYDRGGDCRFVITHRTNRFGEDVEVRRRICD